MTDTENTQHPFSNGEDPQPDTDAPHSTTSSSQWDAAAKDFQRLGESIAEAVKSAWENETTQRQMNDLKEGLHSMTEQVGQVVEEARQTITSDDVKAEVHKAANDVKGFGDKMYGEAKPVLLDMLKALDDGLKKMIDHLEAAAQPQSEPAPASSVENDSPPPETDA